jgi:hypothetical protein
MLIGSVTKQPDDRISRDIDCTEWLAFYADTIQTVDATADDTELSVLNVTHAGGVIRVWLAGGLSGVTYKVTVAVETNGGRREEHEFRVRVREY